MGNTLKTGDWIKDNIIGRGVYEVVSISRFHINVRCLRIFGGQHPDYRGHITCCHRGLDGYGKRIEINLEKWYDKKLERR